MIINLKSPTELSGFYVVYSGSTNIEKIGYRGVSHLSEHLQCKGFEYLQDKFEELGIDWNAYTSGDNVVFHITGLQEQIVEWREKFLALLKDVKITKEEFEKEKKIVIEELLDSFNEQYSSHSENLDRKLYGYYNPIGSKDDLEKLSYEDYLAFQADLYSAPSKIINITKDSDFVSDIKFSDRQVDVEYSILAEPNTDYLITNEYKDKTSIILRSKLYNEDFAIMKVITKILGGGLNSPLYQEVREIRGLAYFVYCYQSKMNNQAHITISTVTSNKNTELACNVIKDVISNPDKYLTKERFEIAKNSMLISKKKSDINRYKNIDKWIDPIEWSAANIIEDLTYDKLREVYDRHFNIENFYTSTDKTEF